MIRRPEKVNRINRYMVRAPRFSTDVPVKAKTFGSPVPFKLSTSNVSLSGLLITSDANESIPFVVNTIVELTVGPAPGLIKDPVNFVGKIVRKSAVFMKDGKPLIDFGVKIVDMDDKNCALWRTFMETLESTTLQKTAT